MLRRFLKLASVSVLFSLAPLANAEAPQWNPSAADLAQLVQRFRPYLKFSTGNRQEARPMTWQNIYNNAALVNGNTTVLPVGGFAGPNASKVLTYANINGDAGTAANYKIVVNDQAQYGEYWPQVVQGDGIYAHVIWLKTVTNTPTSPELVNIEYHVLFGLNVGYVPAEDHKGDLIGVEVVYDHKLDKLVRATFSEHGKTLIMFDLANAAAPESATITGKDPNGTRLQDQRVRP
jgi:hypothetical protein